jgi:hypothetical protein
MEEEGDVPDTAGERAMDAMGLPLEINDGQLPGSIN